MIPLSLLATFIGLTIRGIPANLLSLGAMDFGIIVDGAVIVVENIVRHLSQLRGTPDADTRRATILDATVQVGRPTFFSMLIIILAQPADLHAAAAGGADLRADGLHDHGGADRIAAVLADAGAAAVLRAAEEGAARRERAGARVPARLPGRARRGAGAPARRASSAPWRCWRSAWAPPRSSAASSCRS